MKFEHIPKVENAYGFVHVIDMKGLEWSVEKYCIVGHNTNIPIERCSPVYLERILQEGSSV